MAKFVVHYTLPQDKKLSVEDMRSLIEAANGRPKGGYAQIYKFLDPMEVTSFMTSMYIVEYGGTHKELMEAFLDFLSCDVKEKLEVFITPLDSEWSFFPRQPHQDS